MQGTPNNSDASAENGITDGNTPGDNSTPPAIAVPTVDQALADPLRGLTMGSVVHYVIPTREHRAAIVVRVGDIETDFEVRGTINLRVFLDAADAGQELDERRNYVPFDDTEFPAENTWHWPERA